MTRAHANCVDGVTAAGNGVTHCDEGMYIWGNRVVHTSHTQACERGYLYTTCTTIIEIVTDTIE